MISSLKVLSIFILSVFFLTLAVRPVLAATDQNVFKTEVKKEMVYASDVDQEEDDEDEDEQ